MSRIDEIKKMLKTDPSDSFLCYALALEYEKAGSTKTAIKVLEDLITENPDYLGAYYKIGQLYESGENMEKAIEIYHQGIKLANEKEDNKSKGELEEALWLIEEES